MDKSAYQLLRFSVENQVANLDSGVVDSTAFTNSLMRLFLQALSSEQVRQQSLKRELLTFRRRPDLTVPGWAFRKPGISSRLPTL